MVTARRINPYSVLPRLVLDTLIFAEPYNRLDRGQIQKFASEWEIDFFPKNTLILESGRSIVEFVYLIQKGGVREFTGTLDDPILLDFHDSGECFGIKPLLLGRPSDVTVEALEDTYCFLLRREKFLDLLNNNPEIGRFFVDALSDESIEPAYHYIKTRVKVSRGDYYSLGFKVSDLLKSRPEFIESTVKIADAAKIMSRLKISSLLINDPAGKLIGLVTDKDLRTKVVGNAFDITMEIGKIIDALPHKIPADTPCFEALLQIINQQTEYLVVEDGHQVLGVINSQDIMIFQGASPFYLMREIATGNDAESLAGVASKILLLVRRLLEEGAKAENIIKMISMLNDALSERLFRISVKTLGVKDYPFALIYFGNQGRREPTFGFHMQAYLLFDESPDIVRKHKIHRYFELCSHYIENTPLFRIHSPVSNSSAGTKIICRSLSSWREFVSGMLTVRSSKDAVNFGMMFDVRPGFGDGEIIENALSSTLNALSKHPSFLFHLAGNFIRNYPPVSFYRGSIVERDSLSKSRFNIKTRGLDLFVNFARITALRYGIEETNTYYRLRMLWENGKISGEFYSDMREAYEFQNQLLLVHQLNQIENGKQPDCTIDPAMLTYLERRILKEAFSVMNRMGSFVKEEFRFLI